MEWIEEMVRICEPETKEENTNNSSKVQLSNDDIATIAKSVVDMMNSNTSTNVVDESVSEPQEESEV